jgi:mannonate dehydratase
VLFNAMSGVDIALWDIKAKRANMPLYQLLGGKVRQGADCYYHASGNSFEQVEASARQGMQQGFRHVRVQASTPGYAGYGAGGAGTLAGNPSEAIGPTNPRSIWESAPYVRMVPRLFEHLRTKLGEEVELLHDVHERIRLPEAVSLCKALEPYRLFFLEDPLPPEENDHFRLLREQTSIPIAMGELFNSQHEYVPLIKDRLIDFIRIHISQIGGLSPARKVAALCEYFGVRTAWHGPGDASPLAHAAQLALELNSYNFGVHEGASFGSEAQAVFVGCPTFKDGRMMAEERPGLGMEVDEKAAARFPYPPGPANFDYSWGNTRRLDGTVIRP